MNMSGEMLILREGEEPDRTAIHDLLVSCEMDPGHPPIEYLVAEVAGQVVGAAHLEWHDQAAYLHQIVVDLAWRGKGIGIALIRKIAANFPDFHVIARGEAIGFYQKLGFQPMDWEQAPERYRRECETCSALEACSPQPMIYTESKIDKLVS